MTTRLNILLLALLVVFGLPYYWLLIDDRPGDARAKPITMWQLRATAQSIAGERPAFIRYEGVAARRLPRILVAAGQGIKLTILEARSYRLEFPGQPPIVIDGGMAGFEAAGLGFRKFEEDAQRNIAQEEKKANLIVTMDTQPVSRRGLSGSGAAKAASKAPKGNACARPRALAPGLVEVPICDAVLARRLVYVLLADGREYLMTGEIAPTMMNLSAQAGPSRLMNDFFVAQDRTAIHSWLLTIARLSEQAPEMTIVPGHDRLTFQQMRRGFIES